MILTEREAIDLIDKNIKFVYWYAKKYQHLADREELIGAGRLGLFEAIKGFEEERNNKFITYARHYILREMHSIIKQTNRQVKESSNILKFALADNQEPEEVNMSIDVTKLINSINRLKEKYKTVIIKKFGLQGSPILTLREIAEDMGISFQRVSQIEERALAKIKQLMKVNFFLKR